jgi:7-carboxy-7-deazaguanine synthase
MNISELFYSIQGEGKRTGYPSFFIRTNLCNLRCQFSSGNLCDTPYTSWDFENKDNLGELKIHDILFVYENYFPCDIVITGGEPAIQQNELNLLCSEIKKLPARSFPKSSLETKKIFTTLETNGTFIDDYVNNIDLVSISPKLTSSVPLGTEYAQSHDKHRLNYKVLKSYHKLHNETKIDIQWKFVVTGIDDIQEILDLQKEIGFENKDVFLMPEGITEKDLNEKRLMVVELCKLYHFNYTDRLHIIIWGNKRGV